MAFRSKLTAASAPLSLAPSSPILAQVVRRFQLRSPLDRLKIKPRFRNKPNSPCQRATHVFASALLDANHHNVDLLWALYSTAKSTHPEFLPRLAPLISRFLYLLSRSYLRSDQERILAVCNDFAPLFKQAEANTTSTSRGSGQCVCMRDAVLGNSANKLELTSISQCHVRSTYRHRSKGNVWTERHSDMVELCCAMKSGAVFARLVDHQVLALVRIGNPHAALRILGPYLPNPSSSPSTPVPAMHDSFPVETLLAHVLSSLTKQAARSRSTQEAAAIHNTVIHLHSTYGATILASSPRALNPALESMLELGQFEQAVTAFKNFDPSLLSATHVTTMMAGLVRAGHAEAATQLFDSIMVQAIQPQSAEHLNQPQPIQVVPDTPSVTAAVHAHLANEFDISSALTTMRRWIKLRKKPVTASLGASVPQHARPDLEIDGLPPASHSALLPPASADNFHLGLHPTAVTYSTVISGIISHMSPKPTTARPPDSQPTNPPASNSEDLLALALAFHTEMTLHEGLSSPSTTTSLLVQTLQSPHHPPPARRHLARRLLLEFFSTGAAWDAQLARTVSHFTPVLGSSWVRTLIDTYVPPIESDLNESIVLASGEEVRVGVVRDAHESMWATRTVNVKGVSEAFAARKQRKVRVMRRRPAVVWETIRQREQQRDVVEWWVRAIQGERVEEVETKVLGESEGDKGPVGSLVRGVAVV